MNRKISWCKIGLIISFLLFTVIGCGQKEAKPEEAYTRADVEALVEKAFQYALSHGKDEALKAFMDKEGDFVKGELYVFADNFEGVVLASGAFPDDVGKDFSDFVDSRGKQVMPEMLRIAAEGSGWLEYYWANPENGKVAKKITFVKKVDDTWFVGAGMYEPEEE